jgi:16S rRNA (guanine527-N7)-methyltransferase
LLNNQTTIRLSEAKGILETGSASLGLSLSQEQVEAFAGYLSLILLWNSRFNLTAIRSPALIARRHFLDSIAVSTFLQPTGRLMDVGSGAGFPGIPIKIVLPQKDVTLVESRRKKANFMREVVRTLGVDVTIVEGRAEELISQGIGYLDEIITRAVGSIDLMMRLSSSLLHPEGRSLIMHGPKGSELFSRVQNDWIHHGFHKSRLEKYTLPLGKEERTLLIFVKK